MKTLQRPRRLDPIHYKETRSLKKSQTQNAASARITPQ
jgi:hypothetical protein